MRPTKEKTLDRRTIVVGDVHGCLQELEALLDATRYQPRDQLVFLGDLVDRGPAPLEVMRLTRKLNATVVLGNHEEKHVRYRRHEKVRAATGKKNPMQPFDPERMAQHEAMTDEEIEWMASRPPFVRVDGWILVHGGLASNKPVEAQSTREVIRCRWVDEKGRYVGTGGVWEQPAGSLDWAEGWKGPESVAYGHAVHGFEDPKMLSHGHGVWTYGIDTGCVFGGKLTALVFEAGHFVPSVVQVKAQREYYAYHPPGADE